MGRHIFKGEFKKHLISNFTLPSNTNIGCMNGHVLFLYTSNGELFSKTVAKVNEHFNLNICSSHIKKVVYIAKNWSKNFLRKYESCVAFCNEPFINREPLITILSQPILSNTNYTISHSSVLSLSEHSSVTSLIRNEPSCSAGHEANLTTRQTSIEKLSPRKKKLTNRLSHLSSRLAISSIENRKKIASMKAKLSSLPYKLKVLRQSVKRKEDIIKALRAQVRDLKHKNQTYYYSRQIRNLIASKKAIKIKEREKFRKLALKHNAAIRKNNTDITSLEDSLTQMDEDKISITNTTDCKSYPLKMRMIIYCMLLCNVPTSKIPFLVSKIGQYFSVIFSHIPCRSTIEQMARELGSIADLQAAEWIISNTHLTLGFDATTQEGVHINSIHLTSNDKCQVIAVDQLPGGTAVDYANHICNEVDHTALVYSNFHLKPFEECRRMVISNISNTMSVRVSVNHLTIRKIGETWGKSLNELNCHLHPLDTIATSCRSTLKSLELDSCELYGNDCIAAKIVLAMNKMRFKDGKGDPKGFVNFLDNNKLPRGIIPRYRGNRLHILFHTCFIFIKHYNKFLHFLTIGTVKIKTLQRVLRVAFCNTTAIKQMCLLALFGKLLTGPWMTMFYVSSEKAYFDHVGGIQIVKNVVQTIKDCKCDPAVIFCRTTDFFGNALKANVLEPLTKICRIDDELIAMILACLNAIEVVLNRQYKRYFSITITEALEKETASARLHNIDSEELMGMFSAAKGRSPNASIDYISCKLRTKKNGTMDYLDNLDDFSRKMVVQWSIQAARKKRIKTRLQHTEIRAEISKRQTIKRQKIDEKEKRKLEQQLTLLTISEILNLFKNLSTKQIDDLNDVMCERIVGRNLCHEWYDSDTAMTVLYNGRVEKLKKAQKDIIYTISYWTREENDTEAVDYYMKKFQLVADIVSGQRGNHL
nr:uncharacterized protein LOC124807754 [Hydra vulgaris]XP_047126048.1 uncharacterized protein LOC124807754 [Hydra vulgaris]XP_047126050.1 uncharacterized protein LOC124807754 [Hydra vulgaris]